MYRHKVDYRYKIGSNGLSGMKSIEFELEKELFHDGPGEWRRICANMISTKTGISVSDIVTNDGTMVLRCLGKIKNNNDSNSSPNKVMSREEKDQHFNATVAANRERREEKEAALERKAIKEEKERHRELEDDKIRREQEARETAQRIKRSDELRSQGKNIQAFLVEFQNAVIAVSTIIGMGLLFLFFTYNDKTNKSEANKINVELELIEDSVKLCINKKDYDRALVLANKLIHSSHEDMENLKFDAWSGYPKFYEYWTKKREDYKNIIFNKGSLETVEQKVEKKDDSDHNEKQNNSINEEEVSQNTEIKEEEKTEETENQ